MLLEQKPLWYFELSKRPPQKTGSKDEKITPTGYTMARGVISMMRPFADEIDYLEQADFLLNTAMGRLISKKAEAINAGDELRAYRLKKLLDKVRQDDRFTTEHRFYRYIVVDEYPAFLEQLSKI